MCDRFKALVTAVILGALLGATAYAAEGPVFRLTTELGVRAVVARQDAGFSYTVPSTLRGTPIQNAYLVSLLCWHELSDPEYERLLLSVADGVFVAIPCWAFQRAEGKARQHLITLVDGTQLQGTLLGVLCSGDRTYDLSTSISVELLNAPKPPERVREPTPDMWRLELPDSSASPYIVTNPRFAYTCEVRYTVGRRYGPSMSPHFYVKTTDTSDSALANFADFERITVLRRKPSGYTIALTTVGGQKSTGALVGTRGQPPTEWSSLAIIGVPEFADIAETVLAADTFDPDGPTVILTNPECRLTRLEGRR